MKELTIDSPIEKDVDNRVNIDCDGLNFQPWFQEKMGRSIYRLVETNLIKNEENSDVLLILGDMINMYLRIIGFGATGFDNIRDNTMKYIVKDGLEGLKKANDEFDLEIIPYNSSNIKSEEIKKYDEEIRIEIRKILISANLRGQLSLIFNKVKSIEYKTKEDKEFQNYLDDTINGIYRVDEFLNKYKKNY